MDTATRLQNLKDWQQKKRIMENAKALAKEEHLNELQAEIRKLWPRAKAMIDIYNACVDAAIEFPIESYMGSDSNKFLNRRRGGLVGFSNVGNINNGTSYVNSIGMYSLYDYKIDLNGGLLFINSKKDVTDELEWFRDTFDGFEKEFYEWFDKFTLSDPT